MLENIKSGLLELFANKKFLLVIILSCLFIGVAVYVYSSYISPKLDPSFVPNKEFVSEDDKPKNANIYFFYTDWCPHSKKSKPIYENVKKMYNGKQINGVTVQFHEVNGEEEEDKMTDFEKEFNVDVDGYPSIFLVKEESVIEYDANPTEESLTEFLNTTL
jgi:thiol-disulfide isomerase/thioredoxin